MKGLMQPVRHHDFVWQKSRQRFLIGFLAPPLAVLPLGVVVVLRPDLIWICGLAALTLYATAVMFVLHRIHADVQFLQHEVRGRTRARHARRIKEQNSRVQDMLRQVEDHRRDKDVIARDHRELRDTLSASNASLAMLQRRLETADTLVVQQRHDIVAVREEGVLQTRRLGDQLAKLRGDLAAVRSAAAASTRERHRLEERTAELRNDLQTARDTADREAARYKKELIEERSRKAVMPATVDPALRRVLKPQAARHNLKGFINSMENSLVAVPNTLAGENLRHVSRLTLDLISNVVNMITIHDGAWLPRPVNTTLQVVLADSTALTTSRHPNLTIEYPPVDRVLRLDKTGLVEALFNLMRNAAEAGAQNLRFAITSEDANWSLTFSDDGPGMTDEQLEALGSLDNVEFIRCRGLGMLAVRTYVEALGGRVHVVSAPGRGTAIRLEF